MQRDYETRLDEAAVAAADGATPEEIIAECEIELEMARKVVSIEVERRKRREARNGTL
jgi:hypothetical protein